LQQAGKDIEVHLQEADKEHDGDADLGQKDIGEIVKGHMVIKEGVAVFLIQDCPGIIEDTPDISANANETEYGGQGELVFPPPKSWGGGFLEGIAVGGRHLDFFLQE
jgi:hypothetical protein